MQRSKAAEVEVRPELDGQRNAADQQRKVVVAAARAAEAARESGELVVRRGPLVARILFVEGRVAFVHCHGQRGYLTDLLVERAGVAKEEVTRTLEECRRSGAPLGEALVAAGKLTRDDLRSLLLLHVQQQLTALLDHPDGVAQLFLPVKRGYSGDYLFTVDELLGERRAQLTGARFLGPATVVRLLDDRLTALDGVVGFGAVVTAHGRELAFEVRVEPLASKVEADGVRGHAARIASEAALAVEMPSDLVPLETAHLARAHYVYQRRLSTVTVFIVARAAESLGTFVAAARQATAELIG